MRSGLVRWLLGRVLLVLLAITAPAAARDAGAGDAAAPAARSSAGDPRGEQVHALVAGSLDVAITPQDLFDVALDDEPALQVEAARVQTLLRAIEQDPADPNAEHARPRATDATSADAGAAHVDARNVDAALWNRRVALDHARLAFYALPKEKRAELLRAHAARREATRPRETDEQRRARTTEVERRRALDEAKAARTEAERIVAEELARILALEASVATARDRVREAREKLMTRRDAVLGWHRRVRDAKAAGPTEADITYDALRRALRTSQGDLSASLDALDDTRTEVPSIGDDPLALLPVDVPTEHVRERRLDVERAIADARREESALREERASEAFAETTALQREQLGLLPHLSADKRDAITGFTPAGWEQARSEARHLSLVLRYHQRVARDWLTSVRANGHSAISPWRVVTLGVPLLLAVVAFAWGRRRSRALLRFVEMRLRATEVAERRSAPSLARRVVRVLSKTHGPLEWIAFFTVVLWLLPQDARDLLEVQILGSVATWILAGALIVNTVNALATASTSHVAFDEDVVGRLRLRSLRLVGRTVVAFALILVLSARLVGRGTIYDWVFSTCWFAGIPVFLLLVRWWRGTVFERMDRARKKTRIQSWVLANRSGWKSFGAATLGAMHLFVTGAVKVARSWLSGFDLARRVHAYLFKREIERLGGEHARAELRPLPTAALERLHPERAFTRWIACPSDEVLEGLAGRVSERRGGLVALIGARGMGKSSLLRAVAARSTETVTITCTARMSVDDLHEASKIPDSRPRAVLLDDAHTLTKPCIGGLAVFDEVVAFARAHDDDVTWVFAIDASVWPLLKRARDARPLFDEVHELSPWNEAQIGALLADRCAQATIAPMFDDLLDKLPPGSDEIDRQDALTAKQASYERMLWDHVRGNPALALQAWRASLGRDANGVVHVRPLQVPDTSKLESLPDSSLFVLRAVLQLAPASVEAVAEATRLRPEEVLQNVRFGQMLGFFSGDDAHVRVAWPWLREVTQLLERRHLLVLS